MEIARIPDRRRLRLGHRVEALRIEAAVAPALAGPALLDRIDTLNRARLLPIIARIFDEYDRAGALVRIDRLDLDLGRFAGVDLAGIEGRLEAALRAVLAEAMTGAHGRERLSLRLALIETFEHYLLHGIWPYGAALDAATRPADCLAMLIADEPAALIAMLRRRRAAGPLLLRLVRQMPEAQLQALLHRLAPAQAASVIFYLDEVRASHAVEPVVPVTPAALDETLWTIVLRDAFEEAGLEANRKAFLRRLLGQLAAAHGVPVSTLALQLRRAAPRARPGRREAGSLAAVLAELAAEDVGLLPAPLLLAELAVLLGPGPAPAGRAGELRRLLDLARRRHGVALRWLLRRLAKADPAALAQRMEGALSLQDALDLLLGDAAAALAPAAAKAHTSAARAALLRRAARFAHPSDGADLAVLASAREERPIERRRLLRAFAVADAARLGKMLGMKAPALVALLLPDHLAAALAAVARAAAATPRQWDALLALAGATRETALAGSLERRAWAALGRRRPARADVPADGYAALDQAAALWDARAPFSRAERAAALARLLPRLRGVPAAAVRARLGITGAMRDLAAHLPAAAATVPEGAPGGIALAAMLRTRPLAAVRLVAGSAPEALGTALPGLLAEPGAGASLFAALAPAERERAMIIGRLLTGGSGRAAIAPWKVARALARAAGAREWRGGAEGFAALWLEELRALATPGERSALARLAGKAPAPAAAPGEGELVRALAKAAPAGAGELLHAAERIAAATGAGRRAMWRALIAAAARDPDDVAPLAGLLLDGAGEAEQRLRRSLKGARDAPLKAALDARARERAPARKAEAPKPRQPAADPGAIHVANAGLVLVSAYLPRLFQQLDFLAPDPSGRMEWKSPALRDRAVHLLQWLVDERCDAPEPLLALNKLLCGMHPSEPVTAAIEATDAELEQCRALLAAVIANWPVLGSTSAAALRETFLQRDGRLARAENGWTLEVERKVLDILIDQLPWGFSTILHPWMRALITVDWA